MGESNSWVQSKKLSPYPPWAAAGHQGQPARHNLPAGSTPPPADGIQSVEPAHASQSSRDAVPFVHWYNTHTSTQKGRREGHKNCQKGGHR